MLGYKKYLLYTMKKSLSITALTLTVIIGSVVWYTQSTSTNYQNTVIARSETTKQSPDNNDDVIASAATQPQQEAATPQNPQVTDKTIRSNADGSIDTSNWQKYCNQEYGFCVKYPQGWAVVTQEGCGVFCVRDRDGTISLSVESWHERGASSDEKSVTIKETAASEMLTALYGNHWEYFTTKYGYPARIFQWVKKDRFCEGECSGDQWLRTVTVALTKAVFVSITSAAPLSARESADRTLSAVVNSIRNF